jgi:hypothetical protein
MVQAPVINLLGPARSGDIDVASTASANANPIYWKRLVSKLARNPVTNWNKRC